MKNTLKQIISAGILSAGLAASSAYAQSTPAVQIQTGVETKQIGTFGFTIHDAPTLSTTVTVPYKDATVSIGDNRDLSTLVPHMQTVTLATNNLPFAVTGFKNGNSKFAEFYAMPSFSAKYGSVNESIGTIIAVPTVSPHAAYASLNLSASKKFNTSIGDLTASIQNTTGMSVGSYFGTHGIMNSTTTGTLSYAPHGQKSTSASLFVTNTQPIGHSLPRNTAFGFSYSWAK